MRHRHDSKKAVHAALDLFQFAAEAQGPYQIRIASQLYRLHRGRYGKVADLAPDPLLILR